MSYHLRVLSDGTKESLQDDNKSTDTVPPAVNSARQFIIRPQSGTIPPDLSQNIQVHNTTYYNNMLYMVVYILLMHYIRWTLLQYISRIIQWC